MSETDCAALQGMRRAHLLAGIQDLQGSIHANDTKCNGALITHGLLFAGLTAVTVAAAEHAESFREPLVILSCAAAFVVVVAFAMSVAYLLDAVSPRRDEDFDADLVNVLGPPKVFFPDVLEPACADHGAEALRAKADGLTADAIQRDLVFESLKLARVRDGQARSAQKGFNLLRVELFLAAVYLSLLLATLLSAG